MTNICKFTVPASRDIEMIIDYVAENSSFDAAESVISKMNSQCERLAKFPGMGRRRDELAANVRSFPVNDYLIFYRPIEEGIEILRVVSGYRDLEGLFVKDDEDWQ